MNAGADARERLSVASEACRRALSEDPLAGILACLRQYATPAAAFELLSQTTTCSSGTAVQALVNSVESKAEDHSVERALLLLAAQHAAAKLPGIPIAERVKELFADEFEFFAKPTPEWMSNFRYDNIRFREMARLATLHRFPAGQFHWELTAFPRSWLLQTLHVGKLLYHIARRMGGFSPLFEFHLNSRRRNRVMLLEKQANISYYRTAKSILLQPAVKGLMLASWLYSESTAEVTPHLAWLRTVPQSGGAMAIDLGPAPEDSGFLIGSEERRKQYHEGSYRPRMGCVLWARADLIAWAKQHPEFDV